jgi:hypothetical protein
VRRRSRPSEKAAGTPQSGIEFDEADLSKGRLNARRNLAAPVGEELRVTAVADLAYIDSLSRAVKPWHHSSFFVASHRKFHGFRGNRL